MDTIAKILGENEAKWPRVVQFAGSIVIHNLSDGLEKYEDTINDGDRSDIGEAIYETLKIALLEDLLTKSDNPEISMVKQVLKGDPFSEQEEEEEDWEGDDGLILEVDQLNGVKEWIDKVSEDGDDYARVWSNTGLATANRHVSKAIGTWLKSIGVPFEYNVDPDDDGI